MYITEVEPEKFAKIAKGVHSEAFGSDDYSSIEVIDFAVICMDENNEPVGYATCKNENVNVCYMQAGGAFIGFKNTVFVYRAYVEILNYLLKRYKKITTRISNNNTKMLKMAIGGGFLIQGVRFWNNTVLIELHKDRSF